MSDPYVVRELRETDLGLVFQTWLNSYREAHSSARARNGEYLAKQNRRLGARLKHGYYLDHAPRVRRWVQHGAVLVLALAADPDIIVGWACAEHEASSDVTAVHYVYVRSGHRRQGCAKRLVGALLEQLGDRDVVRTHDTPAARRIASARAIPHVPYLAFYEETAA